MLNPRFEHWYKVREKVVHFLWNLRLKLLKLGYKKIIWQPDNHWAREINKRLKKQGLVCYVLRRPIAEVRMRLRLPMHFQIYPISDQYSFHDATAPYSIAFGQSALLLDTLAYWLKSKGNDIKSA